MQEVTLKRILRELQPIWRNRGENFTFRWSAVSPQSYVEGLMARITTEEQVSITVAPKTAHGNPAKIDGEVDFQSSDETVAKIVKTGPLSAIVKSVSPGVAQIIAAFDADLGAGVRTVEMTGAIEVVAAEATTAEITFGTPEPLQA